MPLPRPAGAAEGPPAQEGPPQMLGEQSQAQTRVLFWKPVGLDQAGPCRASRGKSQRAGTSSRATCHRRAPVPGPGGSPAQRKRGLRAKWGTAWTVGRAVPCPCPSCKQPLLEEVPMETESEPVSMCMDWQRAPPDA